MLSDIIQPCYKLYRSCQNFISHYHKFTFDNLFAASNGYDIEPNSIYALTSYVDGFTVPVYEMYIPGQQNSYVYAYGNDSSQLIATGYAMNKVAFYLPGKSLTGKETTFYIMWYLPTDSVIELLSEEITLINSGWTLKATVLGYDTNAVCSSISVDCSFTAWNEWSECSCVTGLQVRNRTMTNPAVGRNCSESLSTTMSQTCKFHLS